MKVKKKIIFIICLFSAVLLMSAVCLLAGSADISAYDCFAALFGKGSAANTRIIRSIRLPRVLAAIIAGAGLSMSGLIMQTVLNNPMASPSTLGVSGAAVFGANLSMTVFSGVSFSAAAEVAVLGNLIYASGISAFVFAVISVLLILGLCRLRSFSPDTVVLSGIAIGSVFSAATTVLQFYATDEGISASVIWSFGDLGRATYNGDLLMLAVTAVSFTLFMILSWQCNAMLSGDESAAGLGVNVRALRFTCLFTASLVTAVCVSLLGIIGFVGVICPHIAKKFTGADHRFSVPASALTGSLLLLCADTVSRSAAGGSALPVGAITSLLGAPFFIALIIGRRRGGNA